MCLNPLTLNYFIKQFKNIYIPNKNNTKHSFSFNRKYIEGHDCRIQLICKFVRFNENFY